MRLALFLAMIMCGCSFFDPVSEHSGDDVSEIAELETLAAQWRSEIVAERDQATGWPSADDCDGTLWAGLACAAGVPDVRIEQTFIAPGVIGRRPNADCHAEDRDGNGNPDSASTTSQDMAVGFLACAWRTKDLASLELFATAGESRRVEILGEPGFVIGEPYPAVASRVVLRRNLMGFLGRAIYSITGGADRRDYRSLMPVYFDVAEDYQRHIQTVDIAMQGEVGLEGAGLLDVTVNALGRVRANVEADPNDWTAQAVFAIYSGSFKDAIRVLVDPATPCPSYTRGSAINCKVSRLFAARLVLNRYPQEQ